MKLTDKLHLLRIDFEISINKKIKIPRFVNVLLILEEKITLIDTGIKGSEKLIFNYIKKQNRKISDIETIILSHSHPDHIGSAAKIKEITNCKVMAHPLEQKWIEDIIQQSKDRPVPGFFNLVDTPVNIDILLGDFQEIKLMDKITMQISKSAGHSPGMLNILFVEDEILFTADSIPLKNDIPNYDNFIELKASLEQIKNNNTYKTLLTSWTPPLTKAKEIESIINEGEKYLNKVDSTVKKYYRKNGTVGTDCCRHVAEELSLPPFMVNPIIEKAFISHIK